MARRTAASKSVSLDAHVRICVLYGSDELSKRTRLHELRDALTAAHGEVESFSFDGRTAGLADVFDELRSYSLMQTYKLVIVDEADQFVKTHRAALERYADAPVDHATLVLRGTTWNRGNLDKQIAKVGALVKCDPPTPAEARAWLVARAQSEHGRRISPAAADRLIARLGTDLMKLDSELGKLALMVEGSGAIEPGLVDQVVGRSSEEQAWAVQEAILAGLRDGAAGPMIAKVHELVNLAGQPEVLVTYFVADLVRKLNVGLMMKQAGAGPGQIAKSLKLWGPREQMFMDVLRRLEAGGPGGPGGPGAAGRLFDQVVEADARAKSGLGEPMRNLECFCIRLADEMR